MSVNTHINRHHHLTLSVGGAQEDYDFHTKVLGLKSVKKTALYDGDEPILHLYYGNDTGDVSRLITCFPMRHSGRKARKGSGQICAVSLSVAPESLGFWEKYLGERGFKAALQERFGERLLAFNHPCGIEYELVGAAQDPERHIPTGRYLRSTGSAALTVSRFRLGKCRTRRSSCKRDGTGKSTPPTAAISAMKSARVAAVRS